jgi:hypothetical protein
MEDYISVIPTTLEAKVEASRVEAKLAQIPV